MPPGALFPAGTKLFQEEDSSSDLTRTGRGLSMSSSTACGLSCGRPFDSSSVLTSTLDSEKDDMPGEEDCRGSESTDSGCPDTDSEYGFHEMPAAWASASPFRPVASSPPFLLELEASLPPASMGVDPERASKARDDAPSGGVTTLMLQNLPRSTRQQDVLDELELSGFSGLFDFCYMPRHFATGDCQGFAFVNFNTPEIAATFMGSWQRQRRFGMGIMDSPLNIVQAKLQGLAKNLARWDTPRLRRIRNPDYHPFVRETARLSSFGEDTGQHNKDSVRSASATGAGSVRTGPAGLPTTAPAYLRP